MKKNKIIKDLVHEYIILEEEDVKIIDTPEFQRLKRVKQLTATYLFPSATHTRFEHSLGVMKLALDFYNSIHDTFLEEYNNDRSIEEKDKKDIHYFKKNLKIAALLHDVGHSPLSHLGEKFYNKDHIKSELKKITKELNLNYNAIFHEDENGSPHEYMSCYCILKKISKVIEDSDLIDYEFICRIIIGNLYKQKEDINFWAKNIIISIVNSNNLDADKLDYLLRDNHMCGNPAPNVDVIRLLRCIFIQDKKICFKSNGVPAIQTVVDSRDMLYLWVYNHHIGIYIDYIISDMIRHISKTINCYEKYFSPEAIVDMYSADDDIFVLLKQKYLDILKGKEDNEYLKKNLPQIFNRSLLKPTWKTLYEYIEFLENEVKDEELIKFIKKKLLYERELRVKIVKKMREKLKLASGDIFIIIRSNKFYHKGKKSVFKVMVGESEKSLSKLLPQKDYKKFDNISFYIFGPKNLKKELKNSFIECIREEI